jgi:hypothetical protein
VTLTGLQWIVLEVHQEDMPHKVIRIGAVLGRMENTALRREADSAQIIKTVGMDRDRDQDQHPEDRRQETTLVLLQEV